MCDRLGSSWDGKQNKGDCPAPLGNMQKHISNALDGQNGDFGRCDRGIYKVCCLN